MADDSDKGEITMRITMVGTGYVGLVTGTCLANTGNDVTCLDIDEEKIKSLEQGRPPFYEPGLEDLICRNTKSGRLHFTTDATSAYQRAELIFVCVGTPSGADGQADLSQVVEVARDIGRAIEDGVESERDDAGDHPGRIIIIKSTVPVGTGSLVKSKVATETGKPFGMASNPEFLKEGAAIDDFNRPDRVVIGVEDRGTGERLRELYEPFVRQGNPIFLMDIRSAEMVKYASNAMLATKISFVNEIAALCESMGADIDEVRRGMCADKRIGNQFLYPGLGYGGSCFPKDVQACMAMGDQSETPMRLMSAVHEVNRRQRVAFISKIETHFSCVLHGLNDKLVTVWGVAFKPGTDDIREAPSLSIMQALLDRGARVVAHDPVAMDTCRAVMGNRVDYVDDPLRALDGADALVVCTDWDEFKFPDFDEIKRRMKTPVIFDGRNLYRRRTMKEYGFTYYCVGRSPVLSAEEVLDPRR